MSSAKALEIIRQVGIGDLGYFDGCLCCHFHIQSISVDVSCRSSDSAKPEGFWGILVRVHSCHMDCQPEDLQSVAAEVVRQLRESEEETPILIRYCDYDHDANVKCGYCSEKRSSYEAYLCDKCLSGKSGWGEPIAKQYDYSQLPTIAGAQ